MEIERKVIIDAGHGGSDPGAVYNGRREKDDTLQLAFDVGNALERRGVQVVYTRINDVYDSPYEKAAIGNRSGASYFISIHRNAMPVPNSASGIETLVYKNQGITGLLAKNIGDALAGVGWTDLGVKERPGLVVLRETDMPAVLIEAGFIDSDKDNAFLDSHMAATADAIADAIVKTFEEQERMQQTDRKELYMVQTGVFRRLLLAQAEEERLKALGYPAFVTARDGYFFVRAGAFRDLDNAIRLEQELRGRGFSTVIVREAPSY